jgi:hypothetical protein
LFSLCSFPVSIGFRFDVVNAAGMARVLATAKRPERCSGLSISEM